MFVGSDASFSSNLYVKKNIGIGKTNPRTAIDTPGIVNCGLMTQFDSETNINVFNSVVLTGTYYEKITVNSGIEITDINIPNENYSLLVHGSAKINNLDVNVVKQFDI